MKKRIGVAAVLVAATAIFLSACTKKETINGEWANDSGSKYTFNDDGSGTVSVSGYSVNSKYEVTGDKVTITTVLLGQEQKEEYSYEIKDGKLKLTQPGTEIELNKQ